MKRFFKAPPEVKQAKYVITSPDGEKVFVQSLNSFAKEMGFTRQGLSQVLNTSRKYKGYTVKTYNHPERPTRIEIPVDIRALLTQK